MWLKMEKNKDDVFLPLKKALNVKGEKICVNK